jgi:hypothetical protein
MATAGAVASAAVSGFGFSQLVRLMKRAVTMVDNATFILWMELGDL